MDRIDRETREDVFPSDIHFSLGCRMVFSVTICKLFPRISQGDFSLLCEDTRHMTGRTGRQISVFSFQFLCISLVFL